MSQDGARINREALFLVCPRGGEIEGSGSATDQCVDKYATHLLQSLEFRRRHHFSALIKVHNEGNLRTTGFLDQPDYR